MKTSTKSISLLLLAMLGFAFCGFSQPVANFSWTPNTPCQGGTVQVTDQSTGSPLAWVYSVTGSPTSSYTVQNPVIQFTAAGVQTIILVCGNLSGTSTPVSKTISVLPAPVLTVTSSNSVACSGSSVLITASGASTYSWMPGGQTTATIAPSPTANVVYTVVGTGSNSCSKTWTIAQNIASLSVATSTNMLCSGSTATLTASGSASYSWQPGGQTTATIAVTPTANATYTVLNTVCSLSATITQSVTSCVGIHENGASNSAVQLYPNPASSNLVIAVNGNVSNIEIIDLTGRVIYSSSMNAEKINVNVSGFAKGIYYVRVQSNNGTEIKKFIKD